MRQPRLQILQSARARQLHNMANGGDTGTTSIGGLFAQLADDATALVRAEVELYRAAALDRVDLARPAVISLVAAVLVAQAAVVCLLVMTAVELSARIGPLWAGVL